MNKSTRYTVILLLSICTPLAFLFLPAISRVAPLRSYHTKIWDTLKIIFDTPHAMQSATAVVYLALIVLLFCILAIYFAAKKQKNGTLTSTALGAVTSLILIVQAFSDIDGTDGMYTKTSVGIGLWLTLILFVVSLVLAYGDKSDSAA